jgi:alkylhydroperoxidase/carboxymuconolactone decarboxylase family protein YurZ
LNDEATVESVLRTGVRGGDASTGSLDDKTHALVRLAGLIATEAAPATYEWAVSTAISAGASEDEVVEVLVALAPIVGLARVNSAAPDVSVALGFDPGRREG